MSLVLIAFLMMVLFSIGAPTKFADADANGDGGAGGNQCAEGAV